MVEELEERRVSVERRGDLIGLFPGSRGREVRTLLPVMLEASARIAEEFPEVRFELAVASERVMTLVEEITVEDALVKKESFQMVTGESHRLMQEATAAWIASGTATLEAGFYGLPYALVYKVSALTYWIAKMVVKIPYIGMVNILADKLVVKEFIQGEARAETLYLEMKKLLSDEGYRKNMEEELAEVKKNLGGGGAHEKAAASIAECLIRA